jgi:hypothetical protein
MNGSAAAADLLANRAQRALSGVLGARHLRRTVTVRLGSAHL